MSWIKKIFHGLNLNGHKIVDAVVDIPIKTTDIVNKEYVDDENTFDTVLANDRIDSDRFEDVVAVKDNPIKEVLDKILFPVITPLYINPIIDSIDCKLLNGQINLLFEGGMTNTKIRLFVKFNEEVVFDRTAINKGIVTITYDDLSTTTFESVFINEVYDIIDFEILDIDNITTIAYTREYSDATTIKNDNYGNPSIPSEFTTNHTILLNFENEIFKFSTLPPIGIIVTTDITDASTIYDDIESVIEYDTVDELHTSIQVSTDTIIPAGNSMVIALPNINEILHGGDLISQYKFIFSNGLLTGEFDIVSVKSHETIIDDSPYIIHLLHFNFETNQSLKIIVPNA